MAMLIPASLLAVGTFAVAMAAAPLSAHPIELVTNPTPTGIEIKIVGHAETDQTARYTLEVTDGSGNHSSQSGTARLRAGQEAVLATVRLGTAPSGSWQATLEVEPGSGEAYVVRYPD